MAVVAVGVRIQVRDVVQVQVLVVVEVVEEVVVVVVAGLCSYARSIRDTLCILENCNTPSGVSPFPGGYDKRVLRRASQTTCDE